MEHCKLVIDTNQPNPRVTALLHLPAYQLTYPGAVLLRSSSQGPSWGEGGRNPADVIKAFGIAAPVPAQVNGQAILDWYDQQLQAQGWTPTSSGGIGSIFSMEKHWSNGSYYLSIGIYDPKAIQDYKLPIDTTKYPLAFQLSILG